MPTLFLLQQDPDIIAVADIDFSHLINASGETRNFRRTFRSMKAQQTDHTRLKPEKAFQLLPRQSVFKFQLDPAQRLKFTQFC